MNKLISYLLKLFLLVLGSFLVIVFGVMVQFIGELVIFGDFFRISNQGDSLELMCCCQNVGIFNVVILDIIDMFQVISVFELWDV